MKKPAQLLLALVCLAMLAGCSNVKTGNETTDRGMAAFNAIVSANKDRKGFHGALMHWGLSLPGGDKIEWTKDTSANELDFAMVMSAEPFISAGLDAAKLSGSGYLYKEAADEDGMQTPEVLIHAYNVSDKRAMAQGSEDALRRILTQSPELVSYDADAKVFSLSLSGGFEVRWDEPPVQADTAIAFVIAADPLIAAGIDAARLERSGWMYRNASGDGADATPNQFIRTYILANEK